MNLNSLAYKKLLNLLIFSVLELFPSCLDCMENLTKDFTLLKHNKPSKLALLKQSTILKPSKHAINASVKWLWTKRRGTVRSIRLQVLSQGSLTEGEGSVQLTSLFRSAVFYIENFIYLFPKQGILIRRSTVLSLPLQLVFLDCPDWQPTQASRKIGELFFYHLTGEQQGLPRQ